MRAALVEAIRSARDHAPIEEMAELIRLARLDPSVKREVLAVFDSWVCDGGDEVAACWFGMVAGELGREGLRLCVDAIGRSDEELVNSVLTQVLERGIVNVLHEVIRRVHQLEDPDARGHLYEALQAAVIVGEALEAARVVGDATVKERLRLFARERWQVEKRDVDAVEILDRPIALLHGLGEDVAELLDEARALASGNALALSYIDELAQEINDGADPFAATRAFLADDWKATARNVEVLVGWREPDPR
jgi:hypothetical protein